MHVPLATLLTHYGSRLGTVVAALVIWFWTQSLIGGKAPAGEGIGDALHRLTAPWHARLLAQPSTANRLLIASSFFIDIFGVSLIGLAVFGATMRPLIALIGLFSLRQICQAISTLPPPPGIIWRNPGFPSLLVTYGVSNDFFFSGHTGIAVLGAIEVWQHGPVWLGVCAATVAVLEAVVVIVLRAHYTLDVVAGALAAWFAVDVAAQLTPAIDRLFGS